MHCAINVLGVPCLEADTECMERTLHRRCVFVLTNVKPDVKKHERTSQYHWKFMTGEGVRQMDRYSQHTGKTSARRVLDRVE